MRTVRRLFVSATVWLSLGACIPYTVGSTAYTLPRGESEPTVSWAALPNGMPPLRDSADGLPRWLVDPEVRFGLDDRSDVGVRFPSSAGVIFNYKRMLSPRDEKRSAMAVMGGAGFLNLGSHAHLELTWIASGPERRLVVPYGGVRAMQVIPLSSEYAHDSPTIGGFFGTRIGNRGFAVSPEVGLFWDRSVLGHRDEEFVFVPSISVHGRELLRILREALAVASGR